MFTESRKVRNSVVKPRQLLLANNHQALTNNQTKMKSLIALVITLTISPTLRAELSYEAISDWIKLPEGRENIGNMHGDVAVSSAGELYVSVQDPKAGVQVYSADGKWIRNVKGAPNDFHGFVIRKHKDGEFLYGPRLGGGEILKMTLEGEVKLRIPASAIPDKYKKGGRVRLTGMDVAPNGDLFVVDGYSSDYVHRFDKTGKYLASFGGKGEPYKFRTLHKIAVDTRFDPPRIIGTDRANGRVVHMSNDGKFIGEVTTGLLMPACVAIQGDLAAIGEIKGRVTLLDKSGKVVKQLGHNKNPKEVGTNRTPKSAWRTGFVTAPHGVAFNASGDVIVAEYSVAGRIHRFKKLNATSAKTSDSSKLDLKPILGKDLAGWQVPSGNDKAGWYKVNNGVLEIRNGPKKRGSVLWTKKKYRDFVMELDFRFGEGTVDSGVHVRTQDQIQIGISGSLKRDMTCSPYIPGKGYPVEAKNIKKLLKAKDWNTMRIQAIGNQYTVWLQGEEVMTYKSGSAKEEGPIGIQLHGSRIMGIDYRNMKVAELP
jgi:hypothetical protein